MEPRLAESYRAAETLARRRARNFYYSFVALPAEKRRGLCAVYAFMRHCDDISDGTASTGDKRNKLESWRTRLEKLTEGESGGNPILPAFRHAVERFSIPLEYFHWIIDGAEMDLTVDRYATFDELYDYCFRVASAVGLVCLRVFGYSDPRAEEYAEACGIAFQLTNILRDIREDFEMGRVYLPSEDLGRFSFGEQDLRSGATDDRFLRLITFEATRAQDYYRKGRQLIPLVDPDSRPALWAMVEIYERLLNRIVANPPEILSKRVRLSNPEKAAIAARALVMRILPGPAGSPRAG